MWLGDQECFMDEGAFESDIGGKVVLDVRPWRQSVPVQGNMSRGVGGDGKYQCTKWAVTYLWLLGNSVCQSD